MIKAVLFDYDGVLTMDKTGSLTTHRYLSEQTGIGLDALREAFRPYNHDLNLGRISHAEIWPDVCKRLGRDINPALLVNAFESTPLNKRMWQLALALKGHCKLGIVTDNKQDRIAHLRTYQGLDALFDPIVVSSDVGSDKTSAAIFLHALNHLRVTPQEALFIDNSPGNLFAPQALGMNTVFFDDEENDVPALIDALKNKFGLPVPGAAS
ncbi:MAG: HAD-IA family hydrolase [Cytophagales bacterium]|nr:HAD-IA family hydrolase [Rhizobacter sp.]